MSEVDNIRRYSPGRRGVYEVWYTTWNHPNGQGYWLRFIIDAPQPGHGVPTFGDAPRGELWFARCDPSDPKRSFGIHERFPIDVVATNDRPFEVTIAGAKLGNAHTYGEFSGGGHSVTWDLRWDPGDTMRFVADAAYVRGGIAEHMVLGPNPRVPLSGTMTIDGEKLEFDRVPAGQSHVWGTKHAHTWLWAHCNEFTGAPGATFELIGARLMRRGMMLPRVTMVTLHVDGEDLSCNQLRHLIKNDSSWRVGNVTFRGWSPTVKIEGELVCAPEAMVSAPYIDPDGTALWCANTTIADARITVSRRSGLSWRVHRELVATTRMHFEVGGRDRDPSVPTPHVLVT